jgi:hypothetical protein
MYVLHELGSFTPAEAETAGWVVSWIADSSSWTGSSNPHGWHDHQWKVGATNDPTPFAQIQFNPSIHVYTHKPILVTSASSVTGTYSWHIGSSCLYKVGLRGFRVYLDGIKASALNGHFQVNYLAIETAVDANGTHNTHSMQPASVPSLAPSAAPTAAAALASSTPTTTTSGEHGSASLLLLSVGMVLIVLVLVMVVMCKPNKQQHAVDVVTQGEQSSLIAHPGSSSSSSSSGVEVQSGSV